MDFDQFAMLEKMYPDGFLIIQGNPDGKFEYAKYNPRRVHILEEWEHAIKESTKHKGDDYWKGFTPASDIPDFFPEA